MIADPGFRREAAGVLSPEDRRAVAQRWHALDAWPDFVPALRRLRARYSCASFMILSLSLVVDVSRHNGIAWDAVISCEMLRVYKPRPEACRRAAKLLAVPPGQILMVACYNFDLNAAIFVRVFSPGPCIETITFRHWPESARSAMLQRSGRRPPCPVRARWRSSVAVRLARHPAGAPDDTRRTAHAEPA